MCLFSILLSEVECSEKSKCHQNSLFCDKVIVRLMLLWSRNPKKSIKESQALTSQKSHLSPYMRPQMVQIADF